MFVISMVKVSLVLNLSSLPDYLKSTVSAQSLPR